MNEEQLLLKLSANKTINDFIKKLPMEHMFLKNYQYVIYQYFLSKHFSDKQLLLLWLSVGRGKTLLSVACAIAGIQSHMFERVIILSPKAIQDEFHSNLRLYFKLLTEYNLEYAEKLYEKYISFFHFIAYNSWKAYENLSSISDLEKSLFIIDEAHLFMNAVMKVQLGENDMKSKKLQYVGNCKRIYDTIRSIKRKKILILTGTPSAKTPFECIPMFNLAFKKPIIEEDVEKFTKKYIDNINKTIIHPDILRRKLNGLIAYVPSADEIARKFKRYNEYVPRASELKIINVEMSRGQYVQYLEDYKLELDEGGFAGKKNVYGWNYGSFSTFHTKTFEDCIYWNESIRTGDPESRNRGKIIIDKTHCPKIFKMYEDSENIDGSCVFYFRFTSRYGIECMEELLLKKDYEKVSFSSSDNLRNNESTDDMDIDSDDYIDEIILSDHSTTLERISNAIFKQKRKRYAVFSGDESMIMRNIYKNIFNDPRNCRGEYIKYLLISPSGSVGITLKNVRFLGIGSVEFNYSAIEQILGRVNRLNSHNDLPLEDRTIENRIYIMTKNKSYYEKHKHDVNELCSRTSEGITEKCPSIENIIYHDAIADNKINIDFKNKVLIPASITECVYKDF